MDLERLLQFVFVLYCTTVGVVFVLLPWSPGFDRLLAHFPFDLLDLMRHTATRGAISGFGVVHLVWGIHDMAELLQPPPPVLDDDARHRP